MFDRFEKALDDTLDYLRKNNITDSG